MTPDQIKQRLRERGVTQRWLAKEVGLDTDKLNKILAGTRDLSYDEGLKIEQALGMEIPRNGLRLSPAANTGSATIAKIPVMGIGEGGEEGWSLWNGDIIDYVIRPPFIGDATHAYAVYAVGSSMEPRYYAGELLYIHPGKPVTVGSFVLVQVRPRAEGEPPRAIIARLERRTGGKFILAKLSPQRQIEIASKDVVSIHKIVGSGE